MVPMIDCNGCGACVASCPKKCLTLREDERGFLKPVVDPDLCTSCGLCEKICPITNRKRTDAVPEAIAAWAKDAQLRKVSSSGGVFSVFAESVLNDGGVVYGAALDESMDVYHKRVTTLDELASLRGSKYVQSHVNTCYQQVKADLKERKVFFTGTPCQVAGLKAYLGKDHENLICADIICHGVPSRRVWRAYLSHRQEKQASEVVSASFRNKDYGWKVFSMKIDYRNGSTEIFPLDKDLYLKGFLQNICLNDSCYHCAFKTLDRSSDLTMADFWGVDNLYPEIFDDCGTSLVLLHSEKGKEFFDHCRELLHTKSVDTEAAVSYNSAARKSVRPHKNREKLFAMLDRNEPFDKIIKKCLPKSKIVIIKRIIKRIIRRNE